MSSATSVCPRCGASLQPQAASCSQCGLSLVVSPVANTPEAGANELAVPGGSTHQPGYIASPEPALQPGLVFHQGYGVQKRQVHRKGCLYTIIACILGLCLVCGVLWFAYLSPSHVRSPFFNRHGLPDMIPLPDNVTFQFSRDISESPGGILNLFSAPTVFHQWVWLDQGQNAASAIQFYQQVLPTSGWEDIRRSNDGAGGQYLIGCQGNQVFEADSSDSQRQLRDAQGNIVDIVNPPPGGSILQLFYATVSSALMLSEDCGT
ncbi:MAG TPA: hypothetical protein VKV19_16890 [Ktedonobacteraceae bacterium]|nr:hypothetical protein [Ktedonobacteraceae bacterium]